MKYLTVLTVLTALLVGCQSTTNENTKIDVSNAIEMNQSIFNEITSQLPEADKFGEYSKSYGALISKYNSIYYTDAVLSDWDFLKKTYKVPLTVISSEPEVITTYQAVNALGAEFVVTKVDMYENRVLLKNAALSPIPVDVARNLDGTKVRIYYKLTNQSRYGDSGPQSPQNICKNQRYSTPKSTSPFDFWDHGCEISARAIKFVSLKDGSELDLKELKSYESTANYDMQERGLDLIESYLSNLK